MIKKIKDFIVAHKLINQGETILAACSGGTDSLALVHILLGLRSEYNINVVVAHVDHCFRGEESAADAEFVERFCDQYDLERYITVIDVPRSMVEMGKSAQEAARELRYDYLRRIAYQLGGSKIATGHHADDQAETVLINLLRGAGSTGLRGMLPINGGVIRPLLAVTRREMEHYCREKGLQPRMDSSNLKQDYLRNVVRLQLLPLLQNRYNPSIVDALGRTATVIGEEHEYVRLAAEQAWKQTVRDQGQQFVIDPLLNTLHRAVRREVIRLAIEKKHGNLKGITFCHVEKIIEMLEIGRVGAILELPGGLAVRKNYNSISLGSRNQLSVQSRNMMAGVVVTTPGLTCVIQLGITVQAEFIQKLPAIREAHTAYFDWEQLQLPLLVRNRQLGDKFVPAGMTGSKKLKDYFIDSKIARENRDSVPIFCDQQGIIWLGGLRQSRIAQVTEKTTKILKLTINHNSTSVQHEGQKGHEL